MPQRNASGLRAAGQASYVRETARRQVACRSSRGHGQLDRDCPRLLGEVMHDRVRSLIDAQRVPSDGRSQCPKGGGPSRWLVVRIHPPALYPSFVAVTVALLLLPVLGLCLFLIFPAGRGGAVSVPSRFRAGYDEPAPAGCRSVRPRPRISEHVIAARIRMRHAMG